jgi:hypothetical protein
LFYAAPYVRETEPCGSFHRHWIEEAYEWFNENLTVPLARDLDRRAVFWFRPEARECVQAAWNLTTAYRDVGIAVSLRRTDCPGRIVYADQNQIAAIPYWHFGRGPPNRSLSEYVPEVCRIRIRPCEGRGPSSIPGEEIGQINEVSEKRPEVYRDKPRPRRTLFSSR